MLQCACQQLAVRYRILIILQNIYTLDLDSKGELLITIMLSLAQEESRSISENVTWGQRKRFADGKVRLPYKQFLGYRKGADGFPEIVPEEAETIRLIYRLFMQGKNTNLIAKTLTEQGIPTPSGRDVWKQKTIESILRNEKYKGSALLQKTFTVDFLEKKKKVNEGEIPQYYVEHSHPMFGAPVAYFFEYLLGIRQTEESAGYESLFIAPQATDRFGRMSGSIKTPKGTVAVSYKNENAKISFEVLITQNTKAKFIFAGKETELHEGENKLEFTV